MTELLINGDVLDYTDYEGTQDALFNKLIHFIELKSDQTRKDSVEVINACDYCGHALQKPYDSFASEVNPSDIWYVSILDENEEDWVNIMGEDADFTQEQIQIYRCKACGKWEISPDG
ncbi:hypothetical protein [Bacillus luti]|uniref:hypothetical protein n=1 Tax=Bacillus luti TaxID=2026191 RepID=UPI0028986C98|nr:hypothetical protein [Bacillus luti]